MRESDTRQFILDMLPLSCCHPAKLAAALPIVPASRPAPRRIESLPCIRAGNSLDGSRLREIRRHRAGMYRMAFRRFEPKPHPEPQLQPQPDTFAKRELTICPCVRAVCLADAVLCGRPWRGRLPEHVPRVTDMREVNLDDVRPALGSRVMVGPGRVHRPYVRRR